MLEIVHIVLEDHKVFSATRERFLGREDTYVFISPEQLTLFRRKAVSLGQF